MDNTVILWIILAILIIFSAIFSSSETAFTSFNRIRMKQYAAEGNKGAQRVLRISEDYNKVITAILIGNNIVNIGASSIGTVIFTIYFGAAGPGIAMVVITILVLIAGEVTPKNYGKEHAESVAIASSGFLSFIIIIFRPFIFLFGKLKEFVSRLNKKEKQPSVTEQELKVIIEEIEDEGVLEDHESRLVRSALDFDETTAEQILIPRVDLVSIELQTDNEEIKDLFISERFSRIPVYDKDIDNIIGVLYEKDFLREYLRRNQFNIKPILHKPLFVPPKMKISDLLKQIQKTRTHMVIVADQYGGVEGIITLEDILEELVGEIYDEDDDVIPDVKPIGEGKYYVNPDMNLEDLLEELDCNPADFKTEGNTVGGWVLEQFEKLPQEGDSFSSCGLKVTVVSLEEKRMTALKIEKINQDQD